MKIMLQNIQKKKKQLHKKKQKYLILIIKLEEMNSTIRWKTVYDYYIKMSIAYDLKTWKVESDTEATRRVWCRHNMFIRDMCELASE
jgi:hypothetical protein